MQINEIKIKNYGKFEDFTLSFTDGLNIVYGPNEAGKSTVNSFIKAMLYGLKSGNISKLRSSDRVKYMPWNGASMSGSLVFSHDNNTLLIERTFKKTPSSDTLSITKHSTGDNVNIENGDSVGEILFGIPETMFEKTLWIKQSSTFIGGNDDEITKRLINIVHTGDEDVSHRTAIEKLNNDEKSLKARDGRSAKGIIDVLQREREELLQTKLRIENKQQELEQYDLENKKLKHDLSELDNQIKYYKNLQETSIAWEKENKALEIQKYRMRIEKLKTSETYKKYIDITDDIKNDIRQKNFVLEQYLQQNENLQDSSIYDEKLTQTYKKLGMGRAFMIVGAVISIFSAAWLALTLISMILPVIILSLSFAFYGHKIIKNSYKTANEIQSNIDETEKNKSIQSERINEIKTQLSALYTSLEVENYTDLLDKCTAAQSIDTEIKLIEDNIKSIQKSDDYDELLQHMNKSDTPPPSLSKQEIDNTLDVLQKKYINTSEKLKDITRDINMLFANEPNLSEILTHIQKNEYDMLEAQKQLSSVQMAKEYIEKAFSDIQNNFGPKLNAKVNTIINQLTNGKYSDLKVSENYHIKIINDGTLREGEYLSDGTYDQIYFALRLGIVELLCTKGAILFLDDTFTQYDDNRLMTAMNLIKQLSQNMQVIMFTCQSRDVTTARELGNVNIIDIS